MTKHYPSSKTVLVSVVRFKVTHTFNVNSGFTADSHTYDYSKKKRSGGDLSDSSTMRAILPDANVHVSYLMATVSLNF